MLGNNQQAVVIEVPLEKTDATKKEHVIKRLLEKDAPPPSLEAIDQKLAKARELRESETQKKLGQITNERLSRARERRTNVVAEQTTKIRNALDVKMDIAIKKRSQNLDLVIQRAQKETEKLALATQSRQTRVESLRSKHQENLEKLNQTQIKKEQLDKDTVLKAKNHTDKVLGVLQSKKEREAQQQQTKEQEFAQKLKNAQERKNTLTKKKIETAKISQFKRSPSKDQGSPKKEE